MEPGGHDAIMAFRVIFIFGQIGGAYISMTILDCDNTIYDNAIEMYFHEYFENRGIDISGLEFQRINNSLYEGALRYIYRKLFKPDRDTIRYNNKKTKIDLRDIDLLEEIVEDYSDIVKDYNIKPFKQFFTALTGICKDTLCSWRNKEYDHQGLSSRYSDLVKKIDILSGEQIQNNLADDRIGHQSLANNDDDVGLGYAKGNNQLLLTDIKVLTAEELPKLGGDEVKGVDVVVDGE